MLNVSNLNDPFMFPDSGGEPVLQRCIVRVLVPPGTGASAAVIESKAEAILPVMKGSVRGQLNKLIVLGEIRREGDNYIHVCGQTRRPRPRVRPRRTL